LTVIAKTSPATMDSPTAIEAIANSPMDLRSNFDGYYATSIAEARELESATLFLSDSHLTSLPAEIGDLHSLTCLYVNGAQLTSLPPQIGDLTSLRELNLSSNRLSSLPVEIFNLSGLGVLDLSDNELTGLPPEIGAMESMEMLNLSGNRLIGLPPEIGELVYLEALDVSRNELSELPVEIGGLADLYSFNISANKFTHWPLELNALINLESLDLSDNPIPVLTLMRVQILGTVSADTPTPVWSKDDAAASQEVYMVEVSAELQKRFDKLFALRVIGKGMIDALIDDGDFVIVTPTSHANNGDMVVAWFKIEEDSILHKFYSEGRFVRLQPANSTMSPIYAPKENVEVHGKVVSIIRNLG